MRRFGIKQELTTKDELPISKCFLSNSGHDITPLSNTPLSQQDKSILKANLDESISTIIKSRNVDDIANLRNKNRLSTFCERKKLSLVLKILNAIIGHTWEKVREAYMCQHMVVSLSSHLATELGPLLTTATTPLILSSASLAMPVIFRLSEAKDNLLASNFDVRGPLN